MQVTIHALSQVAQEAEIELSKDELQPHFERAYERFRPKAELKGFRKGKIPMAMIKQLYGEAIEQDALETIAGDVYHQTMEERDIRPVGKPAMVDMDFKRGEHFRFKIKYEVMPPIELKKYKGLSVEKPVHQVTDGEIDAEILHLRRSNSTLTPADAVTDRDFLVTADVQELDDTGSPLIGKKDLNAKFYLSDDSLAQEIRDALAHAESGGVYRATFETKHGDHAHKTSVALTVKKIERVTLPELDDAFVKKLTADRVPAVEEFRKNLRSDLERYWGDQATRALNDALAGEVVRSHEFIVPDAFVESILDGFVEDIKNRSRDKRLPAGFDEEKYRAENRATAIWQAKWVLLREKIAEAEHLAVGDNELEKLAETDAERMGIAKDKLVAYYKNSHSAGERLLSDKIMSFLRENAHIKEVVIQE